MESALVRKDAVMIHEPARTQMRATAAGAVVAVAIILGFLVYGLIKPKGTLPDNGIVISEQTGAVFVATSNPRQLIPVANMASARLLLMTTGGTASGTPSRVDESKLTDVPRGAFTGIPGAPELLPDKDLRVSPEWAVCDQLSRKLDLPDPDERPELRTTALAGIAAPGRRLGPKEGLLLAAPNGQTYLVFTADDEMGMTGTATVRAKVDLGNAAVRETFQLTGQKARKVSSGLLNAIPEVAELRAPEIAQRGEPTAFGSGNHKVGSVVRMERARGDYQFYVLLKNGKQQVSETVAQLIRSTTAGTGWAEMPDNEMIHLQAVNSLQVKDFPRVAPTILNIEKAPVTCLGWTPKDGRPTSAVTVGDSLGPNVKPVQLAQADGNGEALDSFYLPPGRGAVVRAATSEYDLQTGPIQLVSDRGVKFGIPDTRTAEGLGLAAPYLPAPESILRLLPEGPRLDPREARRVFDAVPLDDSKILRRKDPREAQPGG
ncbi:type VII secretion protein EccB [Allokutzneria albata]|uniref:Type VII secretion protein EccB n=2 Tax=Allokutzneria albata TaxID=211114 RepID=A0A1G9YXC3_ALLAB|nr:type VII secretion protein EccB [Allokutzneria albata]